MSGDNAINIFPLALVRSAAVAVAVAVAREWEQITALCRATRGLRTAD